MTAGLSRTEVAFLVIFAIALAVAGSTTGVRVIKGATMLAERIINAI